MARVTPITKAAYGQIAEIVPAAILAKIDQAELLDRLVYASDQIRKSRAADDLTLRRGYANLASAVLTAQPRAEVQERARELVAKADALPGGAQADALRRQARKLKDLNPAAPERDATVAVAKAIVKADARASALGVPEGDGLMICYDAAGRPFGVCLVSDLQPVTADTSIAKSAGLTLTVQPGKATGRPARPPGRR